MTQSDTAIYNPETGELICQGDWNVAQLAQLKHLLSKITTPTNNQISIHGGSIVTMDSAGAWLLTSLLTKLEKQGVKVELQHFSPKHHALLALIQKRLKAEIQIPLVKHLPWLARFGKQTLYQWQELMTYLSFTGHLFFEAMRIFLKPRHMRWQSLATVVYRTGYQALPIIALLSFMIGVVITYQLGLQLRNYGANIYIIDLLGLSMLREFAPLLTAIMVAGRTGSAYTAQLGMMKINQEIDALNTMGVTPSELLILPRILGLFISLPLLTMWADIFGVFGGMVMANNMLSVTWYDFLTRFPNVIPLRSFIIGIGKAPVFALIIAGIGCYQGMSIERNADSVGRNTTRSVVLAIFFIIVADAIFSIIFSKLKL